MHINTGVKAVTSTVLNQPQASPKMGMTDTHMPQAGFSLNNSFPPGLSFDDSVFQHSMINPLVLKRIETMIGIPFTFDACCNNKGTNALRAHFSSPQRSFLTTDDAKGHQIWCFPPEALAKQFIERAIELQQADPQTGAAFLLPDIPDAPWHNLLSRMTLVATYQKGTPLLMEPQASTNRRDLPPVPTAFKVWLIQPKIMLRSISTDSEPMLLSLNIGKSTRVAVTALLDSGADREFVHMRYIKKCKLKLQQSCIKEVLLANGTTCHLLGSCEVPIEIKGHTETITALVLPDLLSGVDMVLGMKWMRSNLAELSCFHNTCTIHTAAGRKILPCAPRTDYRAILQYISRTLHGENNMSAKQMRRHVRRGGEAFCCYVRHDSFTSVSGGRSGTERKGTLLGVPQACTIGSIPPTKIPEAVSNTSTTQSGLMPAHRVTALLGEFNDVFQEAKGLPPEREIEFEIPTLPHQPPHMKPYRLSPAEEAEVKRQVTDLLARGWIQESTSPYAAPILFAKKKGGALRMCCDWRKLNSYTIKNRWPLPNIESTIDRLSGATVFSSLDCQSAYHQIRIKPTDIPKTAFTAGYMGLYEWKVMAFGLTGAPACFQRLITHILRPYIGQFVQVYLDDICVYSSTPEQHEEHLRLVLQKLRQHKLYAQHKKCEFNKPELKYLGFIVGRDGVKVDPEKTKVVRDWATPSTVKELQAFLGLSNYFRKFIQGYSAMVAILTTLTGAKTPWEWTPAHQEAFQRVKEALLNPPVLKLPEFGKPFTLISDASEQGTGAVLVQDDHPIAFFSHKYAPTEKNYTTTEQELLGIVLACKAWRCYIEGADTTFVSDHNPLTYLQTQPNLSRRQARWMELLAMFSYRWQYKPGRLNVADPVSRNPALAVLGIMSILAVITRRQTRQALEQAQEYADYEEQHSHHPLPTSAAEVNPIIPAIIKAYGEDDWYRLEKNTASLTRTLEGLWRKGDRVAIPDADGIRERILEAMHDAPLSGHPGVERTTELISRFYWWPKMKEQILEYVRTCDECQMNKASRRKAHGLLQPLPIPEKRWSSVSMDLITSLPLTTDGHDAIIVFVDRLTKMAHFAATTTNVTAPELADIFVNTVIKLHGVPKSLISDRDSKFTSSFWARICDRLGMVQGMSSAFHPQTDGQTERMNSVLEDMIRHYTSDRQDNWDKLLACAEFAVNNSYNKSIKSTPFYLNYGDHPDTPLTVNISTSGVPGADQFAESLQHTVQQAKRDISAAQQRQAHYANKTRQEIVFTQGQKVLLNTKNITFTKTGRVGSKKFMPKYIGPFLVDKMVGKAAVKLQLPATYRIHNVFHVSLIKPYNESGNIHPAHPIEEVEGIPNWELSKILSHKWTQRAGKIITEYLVQWQDLNPDQASWVPENRMIDTYRDALVNYWLRTPDDRPHPQPMLLPDGLPNVQSTVHTNKQQKIGTHVNDQSISEELPRRSSRLASKAAAKISLVMTYGKSMVTYNNTIRGRMLFESL